MSPLVTEVNYAQLSSNPERRGKFNTKARMPYHERGTCLVIHRSEVLQWCNVDHIPRDLVQLSVFRGPGREGILERRDPKPAVGIEREVTALGSSVVSGSIYPMSQAPTRSSTWIVFLALLQEGSVPVRRNVSTRETRRDAQLREVVPDDLQRFHGMLEFMSVSSGKYREHG